MRSSEARKDIKKADCSTYCKERERNATANLTQSVRPLQGFVRPIMLIRLEIAKFLQISRRLIK